MAQLIDLRNGPNDTYYKFRVTLIATGAKLYDVVFSEKKLADQFGAFLEVIIGKEFAARSKEIEGEHDPNGDYEPDTDPHPEPLGYKSLYTDGPDSTPDYNCYDNDDDS